MRLMGIMGYYERVNDTIGNSVLDKELLYKAGKMADLALSLVGGMGLNGRIRPVDPDQFSEVARKLRVAVEDYNEAIVSYARSSQIVSGESEYTDSEWNEIQRFVHT
jgi:hypothetical protein